MFIGVPVGLSGFEPRVSIDMTEIRLPLAPQGEPTKGLRFGFEVRRTA